MRCALPELILNDIFTVRYKRDFRIFQLNDIAIWDQLKTIKTVDLFEHKLPYLPKKLDKMKFEAIKKQSKFTLEHGDIVTVRHRKDSTPYQIIVHSGWKNKDVIGSINFQKMMNPTGVLR